MNCETCNDLLMDYIYGELDKNDTDLITRHLDTCPECSVQYSQYIQIKNVVNDEPHTTPSNHLVSGLLKTAKQELNSEKDPSFWKKWFYSPILVPAMGSIIALSVWVHYGDDISINSNEFSGRVTAGINSKSDDMPEGALQAELVEENKVTVEKAPAKPAAVDDVSAMTARTKDNNELFTDQEEPLPESLPVAEIKSRKAAPAMMAAKSSKKEQVTADNLADSPKEVASSDLLNSAHEPSVGAQEPRLSKVSLARQSPRRFMKSSGFAAGAGTSLVEPISATSNTPSSISANRSSYRMDKYNERLQTALRYQRLGDCNASIKTNEALISHSPPPPNKVMKQAYQSLGECYERLGQWYEAVINYVNLRQMAPERREMVNRRIERIQQKSTKANPGVKTISTSFTK